MRTTILIIIIALQMTTASARANEALAVAPADPQTPATPEPGAAAAEGSPPERTSSEASVAKLSSEDIKLAVERLQPSETEKKLVAEASEEEVAACNQRPNTPFCEAVAKVCTGDTPSSCKAWVPKVKRGERELVEGGLGDHPTGNATVPPELVEELRRCLRENECRTLADFRDQHNERYIDLRIWCTKEARHSVKRQPGVKKICNAIKDFEDAVEDAETAALWELQRALGKVEEAEGRKARADATVTRFKPFQKHIAVAVAGRTSRTQQVGKDEETLKQAQASHKDAKEEEAKKKAQKEIDAARKALEASRKELEEFKKLNRALLDAHAVVEEAVKVSAEMEKTIQEAKSDEQIARTRLSSTPSKARVALMKVDRYDIRMLEQTVSRPIPTCGGFGLVLPLFSARYLRGGSYDVKGPVDAGIGGGYYWDITCTERSTFGVQSFLFSEGLDPSKRLHIAFGTGLSLSAFEYFHFGLGLGYDLFRHERPDTDSSFTTSGFISKRPVAPGNLMTLFTFSIRSSSETQDAKKEEESPKEPEGGGP